MRFLAVVFFSVVLAACETTSSINTETERFSSQTPLQASSSIDISVYDPLAPNWRIEEKPLAEDTYYLSMRAKSFRTGGDGEPIQILKRRALRLQREKGYGGYRILNYSEGIESSTPLTHRVSEGIIQLLKASVSP